MMRYIIGGGGSFVHLILNQFHWGVQKNEIVLKKGTFFRCRLYTTKIYSKYEKLLRGQAFNNQGSGTELFVLPSWKYERKN